MPKVKVKDMTPEQFQQVLDQQHQAQSNAPVKSTKVISPASTVEDQIGSGRTIEASVAAANIIDMDFQNTQEDDGNSMEIRVPQGGPILGDRDEINSYFASNQTDSFAAATQAVGVATGIPARGAFYAMDLPSRVYRSLMAVTGISARARRFDKIRENAGWTNAYADALATAFAPASIPRPSVVADALQDIKKIPAEFGFMAEQNLPDFGDVAGQVLPIPEELEPVVDFVAEATLEFGISKLIKSAARSGMKKLGKDIFMEAVDNPKTLKHYLGKLTDDELAAIEKMRKINVNGRFGTKISQKEIDASVAATSKAIKDVKPLKAQRAVDIKGKRSQAAARIFKQLENGKLEGKDLSKALKESGFISETNKMFTPLLESGAKEADYLNMQNTVRNYDFGRNKAFTYRDANNAVEKIFVTGELVDDYEIELLREVFGSSFARNIRKSYGIGSIATTLEHSVEQVSGTMRALMTTGEQSFLLRQGINRAYSRPAESLRSVMLSTRALGSDKFARNIDGAMRLSKHGEIGLDNGLKISKFGKNVDLLQREELFMADWLHKIPFAGKAHAGFERAYVVGLNQIRLDWFKEGYNILEATGKASDPAAVKQWAAYVNNMTGSADLSALKTIQAKHKTVDAMVKTGKATLFAPSFAVSKWNRHIKTAQVLFGDQAPAALKRMVVTDTALKWRRYERLAHSLESHGLVTIEKDPTSSDFLKFRVGDTRFDVLGGDQQVMVMLSRLASGQTKDNETGRYRDVAATTLAARYLRGKLNPAMSLVVDKLIGETMEGEDIDDPKILAKKIKEKFIPIYVQDLKDLLAVQFEQEGQSLLDSMENIGPAAALGYFGAGVQTYAPSPSKKLEIWLDELAMQTKGQHYLDLPLMRRKDVVQWAAMTDNERLGQLNAEIGMTPRTRADGARQIRKQNESARRIMSGMDKESKKLTDVSIGAIYGASYVKINGLNRVFQGIQLNDEEFKRYEDMYIANIAKNTVRFLPSIGDDPNSDFRRTVLADILDLSRQEAQDQMLLNN